jgi:hypothetical protein
VSKTNQLQAQFIEQLRNESRLDHSIPLPIGGVPIARPEFGPSVGAYFRAKHERGEMGQFYPLHKIHNLTREQ